MSASSVLFAPREVLIAPTQVIFAATMMLFAVTLVLKAAAMHILAPGKQQKGAIVQLFSASSSLKTAQRVIQAPPA